MNVLYVEDYALSAALLRDTFKRSAPEIQLETVSTVAQAIARLRRFEDSGAAPTNGLPGDTPHYDVVLTDLNLPDGLGLEVLSHVRSHRLALAVVILTGSGQEDTAIGALRAGANDYVTKRDDYLSLLPATLHAALERFRSEAARSSSPLRVIYADADADDLERVRGELNRRAPHLVIQAAHSAAELLARLQPGAGEPVDVVLIDDRLPGMPTIELVKRVSAAAGPDVPLVLVTAQRDTTIAQLAIRLGVADYLNKSNGYIERLPFALEGAHLRAASIREQSALRKSEAEFRALANNLPDIVIRFDRLGRHLYVSPVIEQLTGRPPAFYVGKTQAELEMSNDLQALFDTKLRGVIEDGVQHRHEFEVAGIEGPRWFDAVTAPELDPSGQVDTVLLIARDITERKRAEAAVRESGLLARNTVDALSAQVAILDQHGTILAVNRAWRSFGVENSADPERVLEGSNYLSVCAGADVIGHPEGQAVANGIKKVLSGSLAEFALEYPCHSLTEQRWFTARVTRFPGGDAPRVVIAHENITNRKLAEERMAHYRDHLEDQVAARTDELARANLDLTIARDAADAANRAKSDFLAHMSHEIRTPMSAIIGLARMLRAEVSEPAPLGHLAMLQGAADHLLLIVNDVLDLSKIEAGQMDLEEADFALRQVLTHAADMLQHRATEKGLSLNVEIDARLPAILRGDALRLEQIVLNFLGNAIKFTSAGGVRLRALAHDTTDDETMVRIEVRDSGIGITPEQQQRLFQNFSQADDSIARQFGGSGLGLVIARRLAGLMQGTVGVESELGVGSTFWAVLSLRHAGSGARASALMGISGEAKTTTLGGRVLLVEDDAVNQLVIAETLRALGLDVDVSDNGADALHRIRTTTYSLVFMDLHMPVMDGIEATRLIRERYDRHALPIIGLTATALDEDRRRCLEAGMNTNIAKPLDPAQLRATLVRYLR